MIFILSRQVISKMLHAIIQSNMFKRFLITLTISLLAITGLINLQLHLVNYSINKEIQTLAQANSLLTETRSLLKTIDDPKIHPLIKQSSLDQAAQKLDTFKTPNTKSPFINPFNLKSVNLANKRRNTLQEVKGQIPSLIQDTKEAAETLSDTYSALHLYFEYHPSTDLHQRSINQNTDEFTNRLSKAQTGIKKTIIKVEKLTLPTDSKTTILTSITNVQTILNKLVEVTKEEDSKESNLLRDQFIQDFFASQVIIDQVIADLEPRQIIINTSLNLSEEINQTLSTHQ